MTYFHYVFDTIDEKIYLKIRDLPLFDEATFYCWEPVHEMIWDELRMNIQEELKRNKMI